MKFLPSALFALLLLSVSGVLLLMHQRSWNAYRHKNLTKDDFDYRNRQYRRRMLSSGIIGVIGIAIFVGAAFFLGGDSLIAKIESPAAILAYWAFVVLITTFTTMLAILDVWASRRFLARIIEEDLLEQTKLHAELLRKKREILELQQSQSKDREPPSDS